MPYSAPFTLIAPHGPALPILVTVPHAGRAYPADVMARARVPLAGLEALEDRHADALIAGAVAEGAGAIVAGLARAAIDLNRDAREIDPAMIDGPAALPTIPSARVRSGLGLIPRRLAREGDLWRGRIAAEAVARLIADVHRPYHALVAERLALLRARHGRAVLIDLHSMPPLPGPAAPGIVLGTLGGRSTAGWVVAAARDAVAAAGIGCAVDQPYAGGYTLDRHGRPQMMVHAIQIEIDRALYLLPDLRTPDPAGTARIARVIRAIVQRIGATMGGVVQAAE